MKMLRNSLFALVGVLLIATGLVEAASKGGKKRVCSHGVCKSITVTRTAGGTVVKKKSSVPGTWASHSFFVGKQQQFKQALQNAQDAAAEDNDELATASVQEAEALLSQIKAIPARGREAKAWQAWYDAVVAKPEAAGEGEEHVVGLEEEAGYGEPEAKEEAAEAEAAKV